MPETSAPLLSLLHYQEFVCSLWNIFGTGLWLRAVSLFEFTQKREASDRAGDHSPPSPELKYFTPILIHHHCLVISQDLVPI